jgi:hypothetical protein
MSAAQRLLSDQAKTPKPVKARNQNLLGGD